MEPFQRICGSFVNIKHTSGHIRKLVSTQISFHEFLMFTKIQNRIYLNVTMGKSALDVPQLPVNPTNSNRTHFTATRSDDKTKKMLPLIVKGDC